MKNDVALRFESDSKEISKNTSEVAISFSGNVRLRQLGKLLTVSDLGANPRDAKVGPVTNAIIDTLETTPELFDIKSKGIFLAASKYRVLDRGRIEMQFVDTELEGILDGGHNLLAIGLFLMSNALTTSQQLRKLKAAKNWTDFKVVVRQHAQVFEDYLESDAPELDYSVKVELIVPKSDREGDIDSFMNVLIDIQDARNNNVQLTDETKANKKGFFEPLKGAMDPKIRERIEWKHADGGVIKVADVIALSWIPLMALGKAVLDADGKPVKSPSPNQLYSQKNVCVKQFSRFMESDSVTDKSGGKWSLTDDSIKSALKLAAEMPKLYDLIAAGLPDAYNSNGGKYRALGPVEKLNQSGRDAKTKYTQLLMKTKSPEGYLIPVVYSARALMTVNAKGMLEWSTDPYSFYRDYLPKIVEHLATFIRNNASYEGDPQKVGKDAGLYEACYMAAKLTFYENQEK